MTEQTSQRFSWEDIERLVSTVCGQVEEAAFQPDLMIGIARGGAVPAVLLAHRLGVKALATVQVRTTASEGAWTERIPAALTGLEGLPDLKGAKVLIVDDVTESGQTLHALTERLDGHDTGAVRSAALVQNISHVAQGETHERLVDFVGVHIRAWALFPWELDE